MLYNFFMLVILLPVLAGYGKVFSNLCGTLISGFAGFLLSGILVCALFFSLTAFFVPLTLGLELCVLVTGIFLFFFQRQHLLFWEFFSQVRLQFYLVALLLLFAGSFYPFILDHFGYYVPTVSWLKEFCLVRGVANLDLLLGQMSVWHLLQAGFSHFADPFLRLNLVVIVLYLIYIFEKKRWLHLIFLPVFIFFLQSPSPDLPAIVFSLLILAEILDQNPRGPLIFLFSAFVFSLKSTMVWLPLLAAFYLFFFLKSSVRSYLPGLLVLLFFMFKTTWIFGYPVFPLPFPDMGFSWAPNAELMKNSAAVAVRKTFDMQYTAAQIRAFTPLEALIKWFTLGGVKSIMHVSLLFAVLSLVYFAWRKNSKLIWLTAVSVVVKVGLVLWFSAQYRFFLDVYFVIALIIFNQKMPKKPALAVFSVAAIAALSYLSFPATLKNSLPAFKLSDFMTGFTPSQFVKPARFELNKYRTHRLGNLTFQVSENYPFTFDTPQPAISPSYLAEDLAAGIFPQLSGDQIHQGFTWRKLTPEEKKKLQKIVADLPVLKQK